MTEASAGASIFALSFLPVRSQKRKNFDRGKNIKMAEEIGPLCPKCLARRKDLAG
jgi:transcription antitermination factor NusG